MSANTKTNAVTSALDASEDISARIAQLSTQIMALQQQAQANVMFPAVSVEQGELLQRQQIQAHYQEIFHLERAYAQLRNRRPNHLSVVLAVAASAAGFAH